MKRGRPKGSSSERINIIIPKAVLAEYDEELAKIRTKRSPHITILMGEWIAQQHRAREAKKKRLRMEHAGKKMDQLAGKFGKWDRVGIVRKQREARTQRDSHLGGLDANN